MRKRFQEAGTAMIHVPEQEIENVPNEQMNLIRDLQTKYQQGFLATYYERYFQKEKRKWPVYKQNLEEIQDFRT